MTFRNEMNVRETFSLIFENRATGEPVLSANAENVDKTVNLPK